MTRRAIVPLVLAIALALAPDVRAYLKIGVEVGGRLVSVSWRGRPVEYFVTNRDVPGVSAVQFQAALARAFSTWGAEPSSGISSTFLGFTDAEPLEDDGAMVIGFHAQPELERTLGATSFTLDTVTGQVAQADIFLNASFPWSVAQAGEPGRFDVESILLHEVGHLLGLSHSALGETELLQSGGRRVLAKRAVMFPIAYPSGNIDDRTPEQDDIAGLADLYKTSEFSRRLGSITGKVTRNGTGVFGAHVVAFNPATGTMTGGFTLGTDGDFVIAGLAPGMYVVRAEPLDDADVESFFDGSTFVDTDFAPAYAATLLAVPARGSAGPVEITVMDK